MNVVIGKHLYISTWNTLDVLVK